MNEREAILMVKGILSERPENERIKVIECSEKISKIVKEYGDFGKLAIAIVNLENLQDG